ncbi:hypothetical protein [uncultured Tessaracoccus sp.]|uniref:hypothetical protein n=1 Tax=uncultured Tessaracoccus sp. TaxID=905023 RepID=UPI0025D0528B|nr:hypothetical protein [uncultured Tessaracoccus sp.]
MTVAQGVTGARLGTSVLGARTTDVRAVNASAVVRALLRRPRPRGELAETLQLNHGTITRIGQQLLELGLVAELHGVPRGRGRPAKWLRIEPRARLTYGVHIGTEIVGAGVVGLDGSVLWRVTQVHDGTVEHLRTIVRRQLTQARAWTADEVAPDAAVLGVGIATGRWLRDRADLAAAEFVPDEVTAGTVLPEPVQVLSTARAHASAQLLFEEPVPDFLLLHVGNVCETARVHDHVLLSGEDGRDGSVDQLGVRTAQGWRAVPEAISDVAVRRRARAIGKDAPIDQLIAAAHGGDADVEALLRQRAHDTGRVCQLLAELLGVGQVLVSGAPSAVPAHLACIEEGVAAMAAGEPCEVSLVGGLNERLIPAAASPVIADFAAEPTIPV